MSLHLENLYVDFHATMFGFVMFTLCNYPEGNKTGLIYANNITAMNSVDRTAFLKDDLIAHNGGADLLLTNSYLDLYAPLSNDKCMTSKYLRSTCIPNDDVIQNISIQNTTWTMPRNPYGDRFS